MIWVSDFMGKAFEELSAKGEKIGEQTQEQMMAMAAQQVQQEDTTCGVDEEGQSPPTGSSGSTAETDAAVDGVELLLKKDNNKCT